MIGRTSALSIRDQVRRHHIHLRTGSHSGHEPPDVAAATLTEILRSLAYLTLDACKERLEQALAQSADGGRNYVWAPASRLSFDHRGSEHVVRELGRPEGLSALSKAGHGKGDERHVSLALESVKRLMAKIDFFG